MIPLLHTGHIKKSARFVMYRDKALYKFISLYFTLLYLNLLYFTFPGFSGTAPVNSGSKPPEAENNVKRVLIGLITRMRTFFLSQAFSIT